MAEGFVAVHTVRHSETKRKVSQRGGRVDVDDAHLKKGIFGIAK